MIAFLVFFGGMLTWFALLEQYGSDLLDDVWTYETQARNSTLALYVVKGNLQ